MKKNFYKLMMAAGMLFLAAGQVSAQAMPELSSADNSNEHWYYLKCYRDNGKVILNNTSNQGGTWDAANVANFRQFKVVKDAVADTYGIVYKDAGGNYQYLQKGGTDTDASVIFSTAAFTGFTFTATTTAATAAGAATAGLPAVRISRSTTGFLHMKVSTGSPTYGMRFFNATEDANLWAFFNEKTLLQEKLTIAKKFVEGPEVGQYAVGSLASLSSAIATAQAKADAGTATFADSEALQTAINAVSLSSINHPKVSSSETTWYFLQPSRPANAYMTVSQAGYAEDSVFAADDKTVDTRLWKLVPNTNVYGTADGFALQNKATGKYLTLDVNNSTELSVVDTLPKNNLRTIASTEFTNNVCRFYVENTGASVVFRLHAGGTGNKERAMNYTSNQSDNCSWLFVKYTDTATGAQSALQTPNYHIRSSNGIITVEGVKQFDVYSAMGQKVNAKTALKSGVYFVKINNCTQKVIVK